MDELVQGRRSFVTNGENTVLAAQGVPAAAVTAFPVVSSGDSMGAVMLLKGEKTPPRVTSEVVENAKAAAMFLSRQLEA